MKKIFTAFALPSLIILFLGGMNQISAQGQTVPGTGSSTDGSNYSQQKNVNALGQPVEDPAKVSEGKIAVSSSSVSQTNITNVERQENQSKVISAPIGIQNENDALTVPANTNNGSKVVPIGHVSIEQNSPSNGKVNLPMDHSLTPAEIEQLKKDPNSVLYQK